MLNTISLPLILVMDDDEDVRFIVDLMLKELGFAVDLASKGSEAIELYRNAKNSGLRYHAVILDINIPGSMGGLEVLGHLKEIDPGVNAYISSGNPFDPIMEDPAAFGFTGKFAKPIPEKQLKILIP